MDSQFQNIITGILTLNPEKSIKEVKYAVQAIFVDNDKPQLGVYATLASFPCKEYAEQYAKHLTVNYSYDFLTFRVVKNKYFRDFISSKSENCYLTDDTEFNKVLLKKDEKKIKEKNSINIRENIFNEQSIKKDNLGDVANVSRLIYLSHQSSKQMEHYSKMLQEKDQDLKKYILQLQKSISVRPEVINEWKDYIKISLDSINENDTYNNLVEWWDNNLINILKVKGNSSKVEDNTETFEEMVNCPSGEKIEVDINF